MTTYGPPLSVPELALHIARGEIGVRETPGKPNRGPRVDQYIRAAGLDPERGAYKWCACFCTWVMRETQLAVGPLRFRGSASVALLFARNRSLEVPRADARPGDIFIHLGLPGNHCGFVDSVHDHGLVTIEGNANKKGSHNGGEVLSGSRLASYVTHLIRPA